MNIKNASFLLFSLLSTSDCIYATTFPKYSHGHWLLSGDLGTVFPKINTTMTIDNGSGFPAPSNVDQYTAYSNHNEGMLAAAAGYRWTQQAQPWFPAVELALRYQYLFPERITGTVTQYSLPLYKNYSYSWKTNANVLSLYTKLDLMQYQQVMLYFDVGLGASFVNAQQYQENNFPGVSPRLSPSFAKRTSTQFSYNVGAGIDISLFPQLIFSLGYDYQSFGNVVSGPGQTAWSGTQLNLGNWGMNTALMSLTYLFDNPFVPDKVK